MAIFNSFLYVYQMVNNLTCQTNMDLTWMVHPENHEFTAKKTPSDF